MGTYVSFSNPRYWTPPKRFGVSTFFTNRRFCKLKEYHHHANQNMRVKMLFHSLEKKRNSGIFFTLPSGGKNNEI